MSCRKPPALPEPLAILLVIVLEVMEADRAQMPPPLPPDGPVTRFPLIVESRPKMVATRRW